MEILKQYTIKLSGMRSSVPHTFYNIMQMNVCIPYFYRIKQGAEGVEWKDECGTWDGEGVS